MPRNKTLGDACGFPCLRHWPAAPVFVGRCEAGTMKRSGIAPVKPPPGGRKPRSACQTFSSFPPRVFHKPKIRFSVGGTRKPALRHFFNWLGDPTGFITPSWGFPRFDDIKTVMVLIRVRINHHFRFRATHARQRKPLHDGSHD
jgi:hypothetical protein